MKAKKYASREDYELIGIMTRMTYEMITTLLVESANRILTVKETDKYFYKMQRDILRFKCDMDDRVFEIFNTTDTSPEEVSELKGIFYGRLSSSFHKEKDELYIKKVYEMLKWPGTIYDENHN